MDVSDALPHIFGGLPEAIFGIAAIAMLGLATVLAHRNVRLAYGETASGRIIGYRVIRDDEANDSYGAIFRFTPRGGGNEIEVQSQNEFRSAPGRLGEAVTVRYDPAKPMRAEIASPWRQWAAVAAILVLAAGTLTVGWQIAGYR
ncbi:DUF3592 domain-containing protein [Erythrobacter rubeus]|uniref:DUF3592 domain-containing protein n=1 Tax=Erythrobacter rubeus TaxID=2760803 RepID=A0ABR8KZA3_9SPHN|nr:DUF3592 domain-containing protein [Erythrobacter rubeus]MBD2843496.1 DUF3592 domain-containing protein [Erythrobacter rubeus]